MHVDVIDLKEFYGSPLGRVARQFVIQALRAHWPDMEGQYLLGFGYAVPYMRHYRKPSSGSFAFMPAGQGVIRWPPSGPNRALLSEETELPLPDCCIDRILVVHGLEMSPSADELCREFWRVLKPGGRLLVVVPNRRGLWARAEATPFGHGRPFSRGQLQSLFRDSQFVPEKWSESLFMPPLSWRSLLRWARGWERIGYSLWPAFSGIIIAEAVKDMYGVSLTQAAQRKTGRLGGVIMPVPATSRVLNKS
jgi:SAM-dependent methyltransferase